MKFNMNLRMMQLWIIAALLLVACERPIKGDDAKITEEEKPVVATGKTFAVDTARSWAKFIGYGVGKNHPGMFKIAYGNVSVNKDSVSGGTMVIDIKSMKMQQKGKDIETELRPHLLSGDFFDAEKFGTATFEITSIGAYDPEKDAKKSLVEGANFYVSGNLTLKGETKNISFPARIDIDGATIKAKANFDIDRTQWKMNYGNDKTLGDKFIDEKVNIEFYVEARDQGAV